MKYYIIFLTILIMAFLSGCFMNKDNKSHTSVSIYLKTNEKLTINDCELFFAMSNGLSVPVDTGEAYSLEELNGNKWEKLPDGAWDDIGYIIKAGEEKEFRLVLTNSIKEGHYRLTKEYKPKTENEYKKCSFEFDVEANK